MPKIIYFILCFYSVTGYSNPFYAEETQNRHPSMSTDIAKNSAKQTACYAEQDVNILNMPIEFEKLTLIGLTRLNQQSHALFIDENKRLYRFKPQDLISPAMIQFRQMDLKSLHYIDWQKTDECHTPYLVILTL